MVTSNALLLPDLSSYIRENKNRFVFSYLKSLIDCGTFQEIYVDFLPVGHTHCDIDQMFSRFSVYLKGITKHNVSINLVRSIDVLSKSKLVLFLL
jgi:hypothetical protein